jgi:hypothetical protein
MAADKRRSLAVDKFDAQIFGSDSAIPGHRDLAGVEDVPTRLIGDQHGETAIGETLGRPLHPWPLPRCHDDRQFVLRVYFIRNESPRGHFVGAA